MTNIGFGWLSQLYHIILTQLNDQIYINHLEICQPAIS